MQSYNFLSFLHLLYYSAKVQIKIGLTKHQGVKFVLIRANLFLNLFNGSTFVVHNLFNTCHIIN